jgi:carboxylesterase type B
VFGSFDAWPDAAMLAGGDTAQMQALSALMRRCWTDFVRAGRPGQDGLPWPRYDGERRMTLLFDSICGLAGDPAGLGWRA